MRTDMGKRDEQEIARLEMEGRQSATFRAARIIVILSALLLVVSACASEVEAPPTDEETLVEEVPPTDEEAQVEEAQIELHFSVWSYAVDTIQDNIRLFEETNPNIRVSLGDHAWPEFPDVMVANFVGGNAPDVLYSSDHWIREWASAGWVAPLDEHCSGFTDYQADWAPYATQGMTVGENLYGLPYYADLVTFLYNERLVQEAGFDRPPTNLDELEEQALALQEQGIRHPILIPFLKDNPWTIEIFYSLVYGQGGMMFDQDQNPVFNRPGSEAEQVLRWLHDAMQESRILDPVSLESREADVIGVLGSGQAAYTVAAKYNLAELNVGDHAEKGNMRLGLMPGPTQSTVGFVRFYALSQAAVDRGPEVVDAACRFLEFFGGKTDGEYNVVKRWAVEFGLGFANLPLYEDPEVQEGINTWGDVELERQQAEIAQVKQGLTPWWGTWDVFAREQIALAVLGDVTPTEALQNMADRWEQLREQFTG